MIHICEVKDKETFRDEVLGELTLQASVFMSTNEVQMKDFDLPTQGSIRFTSKWYSPQKIHTFGIIY